MARPKAKGEERAEHVLSQFRMVSGVAPTPVDPIVIARSFGINVYSSPMPADVSGYIVKTEAQSGPDIFVNSEHSPVRQRFTCAHELGHYFSMFEDGKQPPAAYMFKRDSLASCGIDSDEIYANQFGAALLMPEDAIVDMQAKGFDRMTMAQQLHVSLDALGYRLTNLGR